MKRKIKKCWSTIPQILTKRKTCMVRVFTMTLHCFFIFFLFFFVFVCVFLSINLCQSSYIVGNPVLFTRRYTSLVIRGSFMVRMFNATFNSTSAISWRLVLMMAETEVTGEDQRPSTNH